MSTGSPAAERRGHPVRLSIAEGDWRDFRALARYHYLAGPPAVPVLTLRARARGELAGVLVVAMPTLNGVWRELAWPGRYATGDKRRDVASLNREVRTIARVIVDPRFRGLGVARRLVRTYLDDPLTPATEAVAAMGRISPFFERAGMTAYELPVDDRDARLGDALVAVGVEAWRLLEGGTTAPRALIERAARRTIRRGAAVPSALLVRELERWAKGRRVSGDRDELLVRAGLRLLARPVAYAHSTGGAGMKRGGGVPKPARAKPRDELPHALTFFLSERDRRRVLRALLKIDGDRAKALLAALRLS